MPIKKIICHYFMDHERLNECVELLNNLSFNFLTLSPDNIITKPCDLMYLGCVGLADQVDDDKLLQSKVFLMADLNCLITNIAQIATEVFNSPTMRKASVNTRTYYTKTILGWVKMIISMLAIDREAILSTPLSSDPNIHKWNASSILLLKKLFKEGSYSVMQRWIPYFHISPETGVAMLSYEKATLQRLNDALASILDMKCLPPTDGLDPSISYDLSKSPVVRISDIVVSTTIHCMIHITLKELRFILIGLIELHKGYRIIIIDWINIQLNSLYQKNDEGVFWNIQNITILFCFLQSTKYNGMTRNETFRKLRNTKTCEEVLVPTPRMIFDIKTQKVEPVTRTFF